MPRPKKMRFVTGYPLMSGYLPEDMAPTGTVDLSVEGIEAIRLSDLEGLPHEAAAEQMGISRQTYGRVLAEARRIIAEALVTGKRICLGGGRYILHDGHRRRRQVGENSTGGTIMTQGNGGERDNTRPKNSEPDKVNNKNTGRGNNPGRGLGRGGGQGRRDGSGGGRGRGGGGKGGRGNQR